MKPTAGTAAPARATARPRRSPSAFPICFLDPRYKRRTKGPLFPSACLRRNSEFFGKRRNAQVSESGLFVRGNGNPDQLDADESGQGFGKNLFFTFWVKGGKNGATPRSYSQSGNRRLGQRLSGLEFEGGFPNSPFLFRHEFRLQGRADLDLLRLFGIDADNASHGLHPFNQFHWEKY